jgi:hypothetical protein
MKSIQHLRQDEQKHFIKCDCGDYIDMRALDEVLKHQHWINTPDSEWKFSVRIGKPLAHAKDGSKIKLNQEAN